MKKILYGIFIGILFSVISSYIDAEYMPHHKGWWCDIENRNDINK